MIRYRYSITVIVIVVALAGCTTVRPLPDDLRPGTFGEAVHAGDIVEVSTSDGQTIAMTVARVTADSLYGTTADGQEIVIPLTSIAGLGKRELDTSRTAWLVGGVLAAIGAVVLIAGDDGVLGGGGSGNDDGY